MKTICIATQKGGQGKTTTAANLAEGLKEKGYRTLLIDCDPQGNLTSLFDVNDWTPNDEIHSIYGLLYEKAEPAATIHATKNGIDIIPSVIDAAGIDMDLASKIGREHRLKRALKKIADSYDVAIIDTPPALGLLTINSLTAADTVLIPVTADAFALTGMTQLYKTIETIRDNCNSDLKISGILITRTDRTNLTKAIIETMNEAAEILNTTPYKTDIRQAVAVRESQFFRYNLLTESTPAADDYRQFVDEFIERERI